MSQGRGRPSTLLYAPFSHCSGSGQDNGADAPENRLVRLLVVLAGFATIISFAAPARADPSGSDATFIAALTNARITYHNAPDAVAIARRACELVDQGHPEADVIKSMTQANPGLTDDIATRFTHIAESVYCPQHVSAPPQQGPEVPPFFPWPALPSL
jgi:Protein of unknown function (DUF732)